MTTNSHQGVSAANGKATYHVAVFAAFALILRKVLKEHNVGLRAPGVGSWARGLLLLLQTPCETSPSCRRSRPPQGLSVNPGPLLPGLSRGIRLKSEVFSDVCQSAGQQVQLVGHLY